MCIIVYKPAGKMVRDKILHQCFQNNRDGAGIMYPHQGQVKIEKGFFSWKDFNEYHTRLKQEIDIKKTPIVYHFRIATHGFIDSGNCHPFPVIDDIGLLKKSLLITDLGMAHNGIIDFCGHSNFSFGSKYYYYEDDVYDICDELDDLSDTQYFIIDYLSLIKEDFSTFYKNEGLRDLIYEATRSRFAFMNKDGEVYMVGPFITSNGIHYSNESYLPKKKSYYKSALTKTTSITAKTSGSKVNKKGE